MRNNDGIDASSVAPTRRAAIVNWLTVAKDIMPLGECPDDVIETLWSTLRGDADLVEIAIIPRRGELHQGDGSHRETS